MEYGVQWSMVSGVWSMEYSGQWSMEHGVWSMEYGAWSMEYGVQWSVVSGIWMKDRLLKAVRYCVEVCMETGLVLAAI